MMNGKKLTQSNEPLEGDLLGGHHYDSAGEEQLDRSLSNRHIQMIAIGGAIGTGLFMGSGQTIANSGTSVILTYMIVGFVLFFVMRAMGELLLSNTNYKSFVDFATDYLGPWAGYFFDCIVTGKHRVHTNSRSSERSDGVPFVDRKSTRLNSSH